jgi:hypothetical protein
MNAMKRKVYN